MRVLYIGLAIAVITVGCREAPAVPRVAVAGGNANEGRELLAQYGCGSCHTIPGVRGASGKVGPPLNNIADRAFLAGRIRNQQDSLILWIINPQGIDPRTAMPNLGVSMVDARHIAAYLYTLTDGGLGPSYVMPESMRPGG